ncbi:MAG: rod-binding protein [Clostridia bacterium]|nr:muramidase [Clostridiales bacterium]
MKTDGINPYNSDIIKDTYRRVEQDTGQDFANILERAQAEKDDKRLKEACRELEAVFVNTVLERMRATIMRDGLIKKGLGEDIFTSMLDGQLASEISKGEGIGIADLLYRQLSNNTIR